MSVSEINNILNVNDFYERYYNEWKSGIVTEKSVDDLFSVLSGLGVEYSISTRIKFNVECIISYMLRYRYSKTQSINWIEPIRNNNWEIKSWIDTDPKVIGYGCSADSIIIDITSALSRIFRPKKIKDVISVEEEQEIVKEFSLENLGNVDFVEDYLEKYARSDKVKRYLQKKGIYFCNECRFVI
jgi:hypothetical protein